METKTNYTPTHYQSKVSFQPLLAVLKADVAPTITVNGINTLFGDSGRTEAVTEFAKSCRLD